MHNKHAEEAVRTLKDFVNDHNETVRWLRNQNPDDVAEALASALHSAVQKEREDIIKEIEELVDKEKRHLEKDTDHEYIDTCRIYKKLQKLGRIDRIQSDREKGE